MSSTPLSIPPPPAVPAPLTRPRRRRWPYVLGIVALLLGLLVIASLDEPPPDLSDLTFEPLPLAPSENAYVLLTAAAERAQQLLPLTDEDRDALDSFLDGEAWNDAKISAWMTTLSPVWPEWERAAHTPLSQAPILHSPSDLIPEVGLIQNLSNLSRLRALKSLNDGRPDEAIAIALLTMEAGLRLEQSRGSLITYLSGSAIKTKACEVITKAARNPASSSLVLKETPQKIAALRSSTEALGYSFRSEIYLLNGVLRLTKEKGISALPDIQEPAFMRLAAHFPLSNKPNKTRRLHAESVREALTYLNANSVKSKIYGETLATRHANLFLLNPNNFMGTIVLRIVVPAWPTIIRSYATSQSRLSATQALLAALLYQRDHGTPPASLDALVPAYLSAIPRDYATGTALRYSAELGVIWSAGENNLILTSRDQNTEPRDVILWLVEPTVVTETPTP